MWFYTEPSDGEPINVPDEAFDVEPTIGPADLDVLDEPLGVEAPHQTTGAAQ